MFDNHTANFIVACLGAIMISSIILIFGADKEKPDLDFSILLWVLFNNVLLMKLNRKLTK